MKIEISERIAKLNERLHNTDYYNPQPWLFEGVNILHEEGYEDLKNQSICIRKAYEIMYVAEHIPVSIKSDELIVGCPSQNSMEFGMSFPLYLSDKERRFAYSYGLSEHSLYGHHVPDWSNVVRKGTRTIIGQIKHNIEKAKDEELDELKAMIISLEALEKLSNRYSDRAEELALRETNTRRKNELFTISNICKKVPMNPANSFHEALQSLWMTYTLVNSSGEFVPLGCLDQLLYRYMKEDIGNSILTYEEAIDLMGCFLIKCNEKNIIDPKKMKDHRDMPGYLASYAEWSQVDREKESKKWSAEHYYHEDEESTSHHNKFFGQETNNRMLTAVVGGADPDGRDRANELSIIIIELISRLKLLMPTIGVRIHSNTTDELLYSVSKALQHGQGEPVIYNDDAIIKDNIRVGIDIADAYNYSSNGCWEVVFPGKSNFKYGFVQALQCLEWTLFDGETLKTGIVLSQRHKTDYQSFDDVYETFIKYLCDYMEKQYELMVTNIGISYLIAPDPLISAFSEECVNKGKDYYGDGPKYQQRMLLLSGFADTIDSLYAIKTIVFEKKMMALDELRTVLRNNWEGYDRIRAYIINRIEKYGNGEVAVDQLAVKVLKDYSDKLIELRGRTDAIVLTGGIGTFHVYSSLGDDIGASANGRKAWDALAPNYSPVTWINNKGPLLSIISATKADLSEFMSGTPLDISINSNEFKEEEGIIRIMDLIKGFCKSGGQILTITSTSKAELEEAKKYPDKYRNLRVRMGGLSAYFITLSPEQQERIISRF